MINYEELGKQAVKAGYDGGGIWHVESVFATEKIRWKNKDNLNAANWLWPDFSFPETEGAALAWIAEKKKSKHAYIIIGINEYLLLYEDVNCVRSCSKGESKAEAILSAIQSLNLGKKDNSLTGLNKRLLAVGFKETNCMWLTPNHGSYPIFCYEMLLDSFVPDGSNPSTIGVATAWLRSFERIGETLHFWYNSQTGTWNIGGQTLYPTHDGFFSELEALVEFAEWAKEEGLLT